MAGNIYHIKTLSADTAISDIDWNAVPAVEVRHYLWFEDYAPAVTARLVFLPDYGFVLHMECAESHPRAIYTAYMDPVYTDSCMEFFADWLSDGRYINFEMNANGALLSCVGADRHTRTPVAEFLAGRYFPVSSEVREDHWSVTAEIPLSMLSAILGVEAIKVEPGFAFRGNFYKCGDNTEKVHYGMWNPVGTEKPDFHRPEYFGELIVD